MPNFLVKISRRFKVNGWPCRNDFWLWCIIISIPFLNLVITGHWWPK